MPTGEYETEEEKMMVDASTLKTKQTKRYSIFPRSVEEKGREEKGGGSRRVERKEREN